MEGNRGDVYRRRGRRVADGTDKTRHQAPAFTPQLSRMTLKDHIFIGLCLVQLCLALHHPRIRCRTMPNDPRWPDESTWDHFNASLDGRLIHTVPIASPCHGPNHDAAKCDIIRNQWHVPRLQFVNPKRSSLLQI